MMTSGHNRLRSQRRSLDRLRRSITPTGGGIALIFVLVSVLLAVSGSSTASSPVFQLPQPHFSPLLGALAPSVNATAHAETATPVIPGVQPAPTWTNLTPASGQSFPPRTPDAIAFDSVDNYTMGWVGGLVNETWIFQDGNWSYLTSSQTGPFWPGPVYAMTYDPAVGGVIGDVGGAETWLYVSETWSQLAVGGNPPGEFTPFGFVPVSLAYDSAAGYLVATNGTQTERLQSGNWTPFCGSNGTSCITEPGVPGVATYDPAASEIVFFATNGHTWTFSAGSWTDVTNLSTPRPEARTGASLTYDPSSQDVLLFGGQHGSTLLNDTWAYVNGSWSNLNPSSSPPPKSGGEFVYDARDSIDFLVGGATVANTSIGTRSAWAFGATAPITSLGIGVNPSQPSPDQLTNFSAIFSGGTAPYTFYWTFGDGTSSTLPSPSHSYLSQGTFTVNLTMRDSAGHSSATSSQLTVFQPLTILQLTASPDSASLDQPVNFSAQVVGGLPPYTYNWTFGDGGTGANISHITHVYTTNGPFTARLTVVDASHTQATASIQITIVFGALAGANASSGAVPLTIGLVGSPQGGIPPYQFTWSFGDGAPVSHSQFPIHTYYTSGTFNVTLTIVDNRSDLASDHFTVTVIGGIGPIAGGESAYSPWLLVTISSGSTLAAVSLTWVAVRKRKNSLRREGEKLIQELRK